jgi:hypothetical protein
MRKEEIKTKINYSLVHAMKAHEAGEEQLQ